MWSRSINGWVSRCKGGKGRFYALEVLTRNGFEDRGTDGERLSFAEQVETQQARAEARAERFEDRADTAAERSDALYKRAHTMAEAIPFGQPILVGHHSEKRDRNYRDRIHGTFGKAFEENDKRKHYESRAASARATADGDKYSDPGYLERRIKENKADIAITNLRLQGKAYAYSAAKEISDEYRERLNGILAEEQEKLDFHLHCLETCGKVIALALIRANRLAVAELTVRQQSYLPKPESAELAEIREAYKAVRSIQRAITAVQHA